ncbi:tryptophan halogenase family protein [Novosphingobium sp.]|uniref:tryptophan halogenase family protein n=1 Tax=Novosphingobium sp. TaxID=1874826 RepID=UPI0033408FD0
MDSNPATLRSIVIVGGGSAGWMTAAALANALGGSIAITLVESDAIGTVGVGEATIPPIRSFNARLGIDEAEFLRSTRGSYKLGIEFVGWGTAHSRYFHPFGTYGADFDRVPLHHWYLRERARGDATPIDDYAMCWALARENRFGPPVDNARDVRSTHGYAYHFDAGLYAKTLRTYAEARGVVRAEGRIETVGRDGQTGHLTHVTLDDGRQIAGDFFVDCSGFAGLLIERTLESGFDSWAHWLPCDSAVAMPTANTGPITPYTRSTAHAAGWQWRIPLQHRQGNGHVYCSAVMGDDQAVDILHAHVESPGLADPRVIRFTAGRRRRSWVNNCVAIGLASGFLEPLESTSLHLIQTAVERLLLVLPDRNHDPLNAEEFNRATAAEYERIRDFIILHYHANTRPEPFWRQCAAMAVPDELAYKLRHWQAAARLVSPQDELFRNPSWLAVYLGQGLVPAGYDTMADARAGLVDGAQHLRSLRDLMRAAAATFPTHDAALARLLPEPVR